MDERIKQLAAKANFGHMEKNEVVYDPRLEKFAELIVFECVKAAMDGTKEGDHYAQRIEQHFDNGTGGVLQFGVEE